MSFGLTVGERLARACSLKRSLRSAFAIAKTRLLRCSLSQAMSSDTILLDSGILVGVKGRADVQIKGLSGGCIQPCR